MVKAGDAIGIAPSQSSVLVSRDGWSSAPPMCRTALRPACKMLGLPLGISMAISTMVPLVWQETADLRNAQGIQCERSEAPLPSHTQCRTGDWKYQLKYVTAVPSPVTTDKTAVPSPSPVPANGWDCGPQSQQLAGTAVPQSTPVPHYIRDCGLRVPRTGPEVALYVMYSAASIASFFKCDSRSASGPCS